MVVILVVTDAVVVVIVVGTRVVQAVVVEVPNTAVRRVAVDVVVFALLRRRRFGDVSRAEDNEGPAARLVQERRGGARVRADAAPQPDYERAQTGRGAPAIHEPAGVP